MMQFCRYGHALVLLCIFQGFTRQTYCPPHWQKVIKKRDYHLMPWHFCVSFKSVYIIIINTLRRAILTLHISLSPQLLSINGKLPSTRVYAIVLSLYLVSFYRALNTIGQY